MQLKFGHGYFNSYLKNLTNHNTSNKCYERCNKVQNSEHLLLNCNYFWNQQSVLIKNMKLQSQSQLIKALFTTIKKLKHLIEFLKSTNMATRKWILEKIDKNNDQFEWRELQFWYIMNWFSFYVWYFNFNWNFTNKRYLNKWIIMTKNLFIYI